MQLSNYTYYLNDLFSKVFTYLTKYKNQGCQKVRCSLIDRPYLRETDTVFSDKFIFNAPQEWLDLIKKENKFKVEEIYKGDAVEDPDSEINFSLVRIL